ncbi:dihydroorotate dehydrogenase electron transfer subunit [Ferroplasma sp.]|uniref:dihydroorotate dehydrogenase electron transfer subunit n=1 Tax=Ferroplasma sp. TaxID=2591003 RepID=UPI00307EB0C9
MKYFTVMENIKESKNVNTVTFNDDISIIPGQFIMAWVPGVNEIPLSFSSVSDRKSITIKIYGEASAQLAKLNKGDKLFYEGPYGNGYSTVRGKKLIIGAGSGIASLMPLVDQHTTGIISGKTADDILFEKRFDKNKLHIVTDDGSKGTKGFATSALENLDMEDFEMIYVCGPEIMMKSVFDYVNDKNVNCQFSLERSMKCGIGLCDSCSVNGYQVCRDGPVFSLDQLRTMDEFGRTRITTSGRRIFF